MSSDDRTNEHMPSAGAQDPVADAREQAEAASFGDLVDTLMAGTDLPPALTSEQRALIETAAIVRASSSAVAPRPERTAAIIDEVLDQVLDRQVLDQVHAAAPTRLHPTKSDPAHTDIKTGTETGAETESGRGASRDAGTARRVGEGDSGVIDLAEHRRGRFLRALPWSVTAASVAAALILAIWQGPRLPRGTQPNAPAVVLEEDRIHYSRPTDALVGQIPPARAAEARARIDMIYADRLRGYRDLRLRGGQL